MESTTRSRAPRGRYLAQLTLGALGVVYGDIGTSPLYALRECFYGENAIEVSAANVMGVLSLICWSLILIISIKYLAFVMRADNRGEGGILALMALALFAPHRSARGTGRHWFLLSMGLVGAALLYGDGMITPAISVLSAVEGLKVATPFFEPYVIPITIAILVGLFVIQKRGTAGVGAIFGPVMLLWFILLMLLGAPHILEAPEVLEAVNPWHAADFFLRNRFRAFVVMGAVFLVVTGGEALYADMGHFGIRPIRLAWFALVLPALLINYFGQGAMLINNPAAAENPFFRMAPTWALYPLVALSTLATVIASQAVISGAFSVTRQAVQLGYCPRMEIIHTSAEESGQIYIPGVNRALLIAVIGLVLGFKSSANLAAAYGIAVTTTMVITTLLSFVVEREIWRWKLSTAVTLTTFFLVIDLAFFGSNLLKIASGGWFPLLVGASIFTLLSTWKKGRQLLSERLATGTLPLDLFLPDITAHPPARVPGTAIFMTGSPDGTPHALLHNLKHNKVLHRRVVFLRVATEEIPRVPENERIEIERLTDTFYRITARYGFMEDPNIPHILERCQEPGLEFKELETTYFLGRETLIPRRKSRDMAFWREALFAWMARNAGSATDYFKLVPNRVVELGAQIEL